MIAFQEKFIVFGAYVEIKGGIHTDPIAAFDPVNDSWSKIGQLNQARHGHSAIVTRNEKIIVAGGYWPWNGDYRTEKCYFSGAQMVCDSQG